MKRDMKLVEIKFPINNFNPVGLPRGDRGPSLQYVSRIKYIILMSTYLISVQIDPI